MKEIHTNLYIGNDSSCHANSDYAIIHACKTCHQKALRYTKSLPPTHPHYLIYKSNHHLFLNMVDMDRELMPQFTNPIMKAAIEFIDTNINDKKVLIHCNQGMSRSPSIGLLYLAIKGSLPTDSYRNAVSEFQKIFPNYNPGSGIASYMNRNWNDLIGMVT